MKNLRHLIMTWNKILDQEDPKYILLIENFNDNVIKNTAAESYVHIKV